MDIRLNELSIYPPFIDKYLAHEKMLEFAKTAKAARNNNIKNIKSDYFSNNIKLTNDYTMYDWLFEKNISTENRIYRDFLQSMITKPFIYEDMEDEYLSNNYYFEDVENGIPKQKCIGLAAAYLYDTLCISIQNGSAWLKNKLSIEIEKRDIAPINEEILNIFSSNCFQNETIIDFIARTTNINLVETLIEPEEKYLHLSDHHGKNELEHLWNKIKKCNYIISGRSTNWGGNKFIRRIRKDGIIEVVLTNTERRYALQVETTGRNMYETDNIAKILDNYK